MLTENRIKHMVGVARMCYRIAKEKYGCSEVFARAMWTTGFNHDIGYEFLDGNAEEHPKLSNDMIFSSFTGESMAIKLHGKKVAQDNLSLKILNEADLQVNENGEVVSVDERLKDIEERWGKDSHQYDQSHWLALELGLIE